MILVSFPKTPVCVSGECHPPMFEIITPGSFLIHFFISFNKGTLTSGHVIFKLNSMTKVPNIICFTKGGGILFVFIIILF